MKHALFFGYILGHVFSHVRRVLLNNIINSFSFHLYIYFYLFIYLVIYLFIYLFVDSRPETTSAVIAHCVFSYPTQILFVHGKSVPHQPLS